MPLPQDEKRDPQGVHRPPRLVPPVPSQLLLQPPLHLQPLREQPQLVPFATGPPLEEELPVRLEERHEF